jgi:hypothetical protein
MQCTWKDNIKVDINKIVYEGVVWIYASQVRVKWHSNEISSSIKGGKLVDLISNN